MSGSVGFFSSECRTKCINLAEGLSHALPFQLSRYSQVSFLTEKVLREIHFAVRITWRVRRVQCRYSEHCSCTFCVASGNQGSVDIYISIVVEETMNSKCGFASNPESCSESIGSGSKMRELTQKFRCHTLFLERISFFYGSNDFSFNRIEFKWLFCIGSKDKVTFYNYRRTNRSVSYLFICVLIMELGCLENNLKILKATTVIYFQKSYIFALPRSLYPSSDRDQRIVFQSACK